jgi:uncharacterized protein YodC (DUF2158 family)
VSQNSEFKVGDTVRLKSGGPLMTVSRLIKMNIGPDQIETIWFDDRGKETSGKYKSETLKADDGSLSFGVI